MRALALLAVSALVLAAGCAKNDDTRDTTSPPADSTMTPGPADTAPSPTPSETPPAPDASTTTPPADTGTTPPPPAQ
jgi:hypothetical protein